MTTAARGLQTCSRMRSGLARVTSDPLPSMTATTAHRRRGPRLRCAGSPPRREAATPAPRPQGASVSDGSQSDQTLTRLWSDSDPTLIRLRSDPDQTLIRRPDGSAAQMDPQHGATISPTLETTPPFVGPPLTRSPPFVGSPHTRSPLFVGSGVRLPCGVCRTAAPRHLDERTPMEEVSSPLTLFSARLGV